MSANRLAHMVHVVAACVLVLARPAPLCGQSVILRDAPPVTFPAGTDSNSPVHWDGDTFYIFNSTGAPTRGKGFDQFNVCETLPSKYDNQVNGGRWIEATFKAKDGTLYGWYHFEPGGLCPGTTLTAPRIGAVRSADDGATFTDLGVVLEAPPNTLDCSAKNGYFAGGHGDFSVMLDRDSDFFYFFFSTYWGEVTDQGVAVARMAYGDRDAPVGKVWKYLGGKWEEPGIGGRATPIFPAMVRWQAENADAFWGPSIHWNTHLGLYVILLNRACCKPGWPQEGIYWSVNHDLADPQGWSKPERIHAGGAWYPEVVGLDKRARETDKLCGQIGRFYMSGRSNREIVFLRPGEDAKALPPVADPPRNLCPKLPRANDAPMGRTGIDYHGEWRTFPNPGSYRGDETFSRRPGDAFEFKFHGTGIDWGCYKDIEFGIARVLIDGKQEARVDLFAPAKGPFQTVVFSRRGLADGPHVVRVEVTGEKNEASKDTWVGVDFLEPIPGKPEQKPHSQAPP